MNSTQSAVPVNISAPPGLNQLPCQSCHSRVEHVRDNGACMALQANAHASRGSALPYRQRPRPPVKQLPPRRSSRVRLVPLVQVTYRKGGRVI